MSDYLTIEMAGLSLSLIRADSPPGLEQLTCIVNSRQFTFCRIVASTACPNQDCCKTEGIPPKVPPQITPQ